MPIPLEVVDQFLGHPDPGSTEVKVRSIENRLGAGPFRGPSIPIDGRSYILYGYTILPAGVRIPTRFEIDTRKPTLLVGEGKWHIAGTWYWPFEPEALQVLGVSPEEARPFAWLPNVPIQTVEKPPYSAGAALHGLPLPPPKPTARPKSGEKVGGRRLTSMDLEAGEKVAWSCPARRTAGGIRAARGELFLTNRRVLFCPRTFDRLLGGKPFAAGIREVVDVGSKRPQGGASSGGGKRPHLRLVLVGGREELFAVDDFMRAIEEFSKRIHPIE
jgi:hypothetical protein